MSSKNLTLPIFQAFSITFFGEWGDTSQVNFMTRTEEVNIASSLFWTEFFFFFFLLSFQLATIGLAADENPLGVVLGGIL